MDSAFQLPLLFFKKKLLYCEDVKPEGILIVLRKLVNKQHLAQRVTTILNFHLQLLYSGNPSEESSLELAVFEFVLTKSIYFARVFWFRVDRKIFYLSNQLELNNEGFLCH